MANKIGSLIIDLRSITLTPEEKEILAHPSVGGIILFTRNYESREQIKQFCQTIRSVRKLPLLIMVDQEGGKVQRFIKDFTRLPALSAIGKNYDDHPEQTCRLARNCGWLMAAELVSVGIDISLAPVLDLNKGISHVIGERAFHADPQAVSQLALAFIQGMRDAGMPATAKHFPGHGSIAVDSHTTCSIDERLFHEVERNDMLPFTTLIKAGISAIMAAHISFPMIDPLSVGYSRFWLVEVLRKQLGFRGVIFSDDLNMEGANISSNYTDRVIAAKEAGCDFTLLCNNPSAMIQVLDTLPVSKYQIDRDKWGLLQKDNSNKINESYQTQPRWRETREFLKNLSL